MFWRKENNYIFVCLFICLFVLSFQLFICLFVLLQSFRGKTRISIFPVNEVIPKIWLRKMSWEKMQHKNCQVFFFFFLIWFDLIWLQMKSNVISNCMFYMSHCNIFDNHNHLFIDLFYCCCNPFISHNWNYFLIFHLIDSFTSIVSKICFEKKKKKKRINWMKRMSEVVMVGERRPIFFFLFFFFFVYHCHVWNPIPSHQIWWKILDWIESHILAKIHF